MKKIAYVLILLFWTTASNAVVLKNSCDNKEYQVADLKLASAVKSIKKSKEPWADLLMVFKVWEPCKDRFQDEAFIEAIADLVSTRWDRVSDLAQVKEKSPSFYQYIIASLGNDIVGLDRWKKIVGLSRKKCPDSAKEICKDIERAGQSL